MTSITDIANRALAAIGSRSSIASLSENSNEARACSTLLEPLRDELLRMAPWNCATNFVNLSLICAAPGTLENTSPATLTWERGQPPPGWLYEYAYPSDCLRDLWIVPQLATGITGVPIFPVNTGYSFSSLSSPAVRFKVGIDQLTAGVPAEGGADARVIWTNQQQALLCYIRRVTNPDVWDEQFKQALVAALAARLVMQLVGSKELSSMKLQEANLYITQARTTDGNEGLSTNDITPDWISIRGCVFTDGTYWGNYFNWGPGLV